MNAAAARTVATFCFAAGMLLAALYLFANKPGGTFGFTISLVPGAPVARVESVTNPGAAAGLQPGDVLAAAGASANDRFFIDFLANPPVIAQGDFIRAIVHRGARTFPITLQTIRDTHSPPYEGVYFTVLGLPILILGWFIIWRKPESSDAVTLGLMLLLFGWFVTTPDRVGPPQARYALSALASSEFVILGVLMAVVFFARFPEGTGTRTSTLRRRLLYVGIAATAVESVTMAWSFLSPGYVGAVPWLTLPGIAIAALPVLIAFVCFVDAFRAANAGDRIRLRWLGGSFFIGFTGPMLLPAAILLLGPGFTVIHQVFFESTLFVLAIGLTYSILRYRMFDTAFVLNRAAIYALTSTIVIGLFAGIQWFVTRLLAANNFAFVLQIAAAIIIGLSLQRLYHYAERLINTYLFARLHAARSECARIAGALVYAESMDAVRELLTFEVPAALSLASAALFERQEDGTFVRATSTGWEGSVLSALGINESLPLFLRSERLPLAMRKLHRRPEGMPPGNAEPAVALPVIVRHELAAFALYGAHSSGADIDPDETAELRTLSEAASRAFESLSLAERVAAANRSRDDAQRAQVTELRELNAAYGRFVPAEFLRLLGKDDVREIALGEHVEKEMTVFFCDIRSFTNLSAQMSAEDNFRFINAYLRRAGPLIREHGGFIDKYIGDAIMGLFPSGPADALKAAIALHHELRLYNKRRETRGYDPIAVGIGLHTGTLMLGTVGERGRMDSTVISDAVNIASRLEGLTKIYGASIILSEQTYRALPNPQDYLLRPLGKAHVRGRQERIEIWEAYDCDSSDLKARKSSSAPDFARGIELFEGRNFAMAREHFARCLASNPEDRSAQHFITQIEHSA